MSEPTQRHRVWEIDGLRGIAIVLMVFFHLMFDLNVFMGLSVDFRNGWIYVTGKLAVILFMFVAGISHCFTGSDIRRGLQVFGYACLVTAGSFLFTPQLLIVFGVLHFFAFAMLTTPLWRKMPDMILIILIVTAWSGVWWIGTLEVTHDWFSWVGLHTDSFTSGDYYPLIPWMGWYWLGMLAGRKVYSSKRSMIPEPYLSRLPETPLHWAGRHSIWIYLIHQPVLMFVMWILQDFIK